MRQAGFNFYFPQNRWGHFFFKFHRKLMRHFFWFILSIKMLTFWFWHMNKLNEATFFLIQVWKKSQIREGLRNNLSFLIWPYGCLILIMPIFLSRKYCLLIASAAFTLNTMNSDQTMRADWFGCMLYMHGWKFKIPEILNFWNSNLKTVGTLNKDKDKKEALFNVAYLKQTT